MRILIELMMIVIIDYSSASASHPSVEKNIFVISFPLIPNSSATTSLVGGWLLARNFIKADIIKTPKHPQFIIAHGYILWASCLKPNKRLAYCLIPSSDGIMDFTFCLVGVGVW